MSEYLDSAWTDTDGDGRMDTWIRDTNHDGVPDEVTYTDPAVNPYVAG